MKTRKLELTDKVLPGDTGTLVIYYGGSDADTPRGEFSRIRLKDVKTEKRVCDFVLMAIGKQMEGIPDLEMALLREHTEIGKFFDIATENLEDSKIIELLSGFEVEKQ